MSKKRELRGTPIGSDKAAFDPTFCAGCEKPFWSSDPARKYCSRTCAERRKEVETRRRAGRPYIIVRVALYKGRRESY
jgi:hypothetical protein